MRDRRLSSTRQWPEPAPNTWWPWLLVLVFMLYWLFAWSLERLDLTPVVQEFWNTWVPMLPLPSVFIFFAEMLHPRVLRHLLPILVGWILAQRAAVSLIQTLYQMPDRATANDFLRRLQAGDVDGRAINLSMELLAERQRSVLLRVGGPGPVQVLAGEAAVTEINGRFQRVLGPGKHLLERFEYVLTLLDLRPQERVETDIKLVTKDGIELTADLHLSYRLQTGGEPATPANPYPYDEESVRTAAYAQTILPDNQVAYWNTLPQRLGRAKLVDIISRYRLDEILQLTNTVAQPYLAIQTELLRQMRIALQPQGIEIMSAFVAQMELPANVTDQYIRFWQVDWETRRRLNEADGQATVLEEKEIARAEAEMTMIQAIVDGVQRARRDGQPANMSEIVALRLVDALEQMAHQSQRLYPLPQGLLPQLEQMRRQLSPPEQD
ncbi:MAG: SPFH domain-containing protein [Ardenticatenaceae bacterium]|nr:SPFH domain-containing protein [Ardenticatenaceae bacterium]